jgi:hypothetical protein
MRGADRSAGAARSPSAAGRTDEARALGAWIGEGRTTWVRTIADRPTPVGTSEDPARGRGMRPAAGRCPYPRRVARHRIRDARGRDRRWTTDRRSASQRAAGRRDGDRPDGDRTAAHRRGRHRARVPSGTIRAGLGRAARVRSGRGGHRPVAGAGCARSAGRTVWSRRRGSRTRDARPCLRPAGRSRSADRSFPVDRRRPKIQGRRDARDWARVGVRRRRRVDRRPRCVAGSTWVVAG